MKKYSFLIKKLLLGTFSLSILASVQETCTGISEKSLREKMQEMNIKVPDANPVYGSPKNKSVENKEKHSQDAQKGWYYYHTRFALPLYNNKNKTEEYNVYTACLVINCASNGKLYLYDIVDIKKEASNPLKTENSQVVQNRFF